jgi:hypothetical protein
MSHVAFRLLQEYVVRCVYRFLLTVSVSSLWAGVFGAWFCKTIDIITFITWLSCRSVSRIHVTDEQILLISVAGCSDAAELHLSDCRPPV